MRRCIAQWRLSLRSWVLPALLGSAVYDRLDISERYGSEDEEVMRDQPIARYNAYTHVLLHPVDNALSTECVSAWRGDMGLGAIIE